MLFTHMLVAYDGSVQANKAIEKAIELSKCNPNGHITVLYILNINKALKHVQLELPEQLELLEKQLMEQGKRLLSTARDKMKTQNCSYSLRVKEGSPQQAIVDFAKEENCDLIVIGNRGLSGIKEYLGSVSKEVVKRATVPVFVVK